MLIDCYLILYMYVGIINYFWVHIRVERNNTSLVFVYILLKNVIKGM